MTVSDYTKTCKRTMLWGKAKDKIKEGDMIRFLEFNDLNPGDQHNPEIMYSAFASGTTQHTPIIVAMAIASLETLGKEDWNTYTPEEYADETSREGDFNADHEFYEVQEDGSWGSVCVEISNAEIKQLRTMDYSDYLKTDHWGRVKKGALLRADHKCQVCNGRDYLHVHHRTYANRGKERPCDVTVLCRNCHDLFHKNRR